jgi:UDP-N-acetylmuramyl pentapeptide phosphotransferase/UDP-N-acetylglucosamine-1-phosphate transferase
MIYLSCFILFAIIEYVYLRAAKRLQLGAPVTERSSHKRPTPTGGGIIFIAAIIAFAVINWQALSTEWLTMLGGAVVLGIASFVDDIHPLPARPRLVLQIAVIAVIFKQYCSIGTIDLYLILLFFGVGCTNAYNFIDGINGILALLAAVTIASLTFAYSLVEPADTQLYVQFGILLLIALAIFGVLNMSKKLFAGDVGSITIGVSIVWLLSNLIYATLDPTLIILVIVCLFDTGATMVHRLTVGENIMQPHRQHIYQLLANNLGISHSIVSLCYAVIQLIINVVYFIIPMDFHLGYTICVILILSIMYATIRKMAAKNAVAQENNEEIVADEQENC